MAAHTASASGWCRLRCCALACATKQHARCAALGVADDPAKSSPLRVPATSGGNTQRRKGMSAGLTQMLLCLIHRSPPLANRMMRPPSPGTPVVAHPPGAAPSL